MWAWAGQEPGEEEERERRSKQAQTAAPQACSTGMPTPVKNEAVNEKEEAQYRDLYAYYMVPRSNDPQGVETDMKKGRGSNITLHWTYNRSPHSLTATPPSPFITLPQPRPHPSFSWCAPHVQMSDVTGRISLACWRPWWT